MNLDKEFNYILSMKKFIDNIKKQTKDNNYINLEYKLNEIDDNDSITDLDSESDKIYINPNMIPNMNTSLLNLNFNNTDKTDKIINNDLTDHYKDLLNHTYSKMSRIQNILSGI